MRLLSIIVLFMLVGILNAETCRFCNLPATWTGETTMQDGKFLYVKRCGGGHMFFSRTASDFIAPAPAPSPMLPPPASGVSCFTCGLPAIWMGRTYIEGGRMYLVCKCARAHTTLVPR